jgi:hypothetical protein
MSVTSDVSSLRAAWGQWVRLIGRERRYRWGRRGRTSAHACRLRQSAEGAPLRGIGAAGLRVGIRTGDTAQRECAAMLREPPDILITTPESLYLMPASRACVTLYGVQAMIVDEIHAAAATKRGSHLALALKPFLRTSLKFNEKLVEQCPSGMQTSRARLRLIGRDRHPMSDYV